MEKKTTNELLSILKNTEPSGIDECLSKYGESFIEEHAFTKYMRERFKKKGIVQQKMFCEAGIPERYGYKLISCERVTKRRDVILRICICSGFTLKETQQALTYYGMPELYSRSMRDAVLIIAVNSNIRNLEKVDEMLTSRGMEKLMECGND